MKYETWYGVHLTVYMAALLGFGHQLDLGTTVGGSGIFYYYWISLYIIVFLNLFLFRFIRPLWLFYRHRFFVTRVVRETHDVVSIYISGKNMHDFKVKAGQFMIFRFLTRGFWTQSHPFSLSWVPKNGELRISCKNSGDYTSSLPHLTPGAPVLIEGPFGVFTSEKIRGNKLLLIAGGIGITPIRSLFEELAPTHDVVLMYANKTESDIALRSELETIAQQNRSRVIHVVADQPDFAGERGRIDIERIRRLIPDFAERDIFICGPLPMLLSIKEQLRTAGVSRDRVHYELFSL